ncbi:hypothetical protein [Methylibium sp.]|uniref:hypothetical protein n=1 Tax=Methylibium sp. TaxID=2067992 RepID=UPI003BAAAC95
MAIAARCRRRVRAVTPEHKQTHKLPTQQCVLYLPDRGAYLCRVDPCRAEFETVTAPQHAWQLEEEDAEAVGLVFHEMTGLRVALRPYVSTGC